MNGNNVIVDDNIIYDMRRGGGAINFSSERTNITLEDVKFEKNNSVFSGGAIYASGDRVLAFRGKVTTFSWNNSEAGKGHGGGAIFIENMDLIFGAEETNFEGNSSLRHGGAICFTGYSYGDGNQKSLTFEKKVTFRDNKIARFDANRKPGKWVMADEGGGGAIFIFKKSSLTFEKEAIFIKNISPFGGAIYMACDEVNQGLTAKFKEWATFEDNRAHEGSAICVYGNVNVIFEKGLSLVNNIDSVSENNSSMNNHPIISGAMVIGGGLINQKLAIVTIVQNDQNRSTEFRGNRSIDGSRQNAFYMENGARLNFKLERGNVNVFDVIEGKVENNFDDDGRPNTINYCDGIVTIEGTGGWFRLEKGGSIRNVNLVNRGNLSLIGAEATKIDLVNFTNSGTVRFEILPDKCDKITAKKIILEQGTVLDIVAARGTYGEGKSYDILVSDSPIVIGKGANIKLVKSQKNLKIKGGFSLDKKIYTITVTRKSIIEDNLEEMNLFSFINYLDENQKGVDNVLTDIKIANPDDENIDDLLNRIEKFSSHDDIKTALTQMSAKFIADAITHSLLSSRREKISENIPLNTIVLEPHFIGNRLANGMADNVMGGSIKAVKQFGSINVGFRGTLDSHSFGENQGSKAHILEKTIAFQLEINTASKFNIAFDLSYRKNNYAVDRSIEKLDAIAKSDFSTNVFGMSTAIEKKLIVKNYLTVTPSVAVHLLWLTNDEFVEKNGEILNLMVDKNSYHLTASDFNLDLTLNFTKFRPFVGLGARYLLSFSRPEVSASFANYQNHKFKSIGTEVDRLFGLLATGFSYKLTRSLLLSLRVDYQFSSKYKSTVADFGINYSF
jgi:predicted outer membrane repeat protein